MKADNKTDKYYVLYVDQYGNNIWARTVKELCEQCCAKRAEKMYVDKRDGSTMHVGYIVGDRWFTAYIPLERQA